jgi:hypothetical protein
MLGGLWPPTSSATNRCWRWNHDRLRSDLNLNAIGLPPLRVIGGRSEATIVPIFPRPQDESTSATDKSMIGQIVPTTFAKGGRLIFHIFASLGQFEVERLKERTRRALAASRVRGRIGGRPPALDKVNVTAAKAMLSGGRTAMGDGLIACLRSCP